MNCIVISCICLITFKNSQSFQAINLWGSSTRQNGRVHGAKIIRIHQTSSSSAPAGAECITGLRRRQLVITAAADAKLGSRVQLNASRGLSAIADIFVDITVIGE